MYYKLPVKERMELMKSYRKANKDMSYQDMVNDYNTSYEKFGNGGTKREPIITHDKNDPRLRAYNDSLGLYNSGITNKHSYETYINALKIPTERVKDWGKETKYSEPGNHPKIKYISKNAVPTWRAGFTTKNTKGEDVSVGDQIPGSNNLSTIYTKDKHIVVTEGVVDRLMKGYMLYKKPVQPYKYEPEPENPPAEVPPIIPPVVNFPPVKKDTIQYTPKQPIINSDIMRQNN